MNEQTNFLTEAIAALKERTLTDDEAEELAEYDQPDSGDFYAWSIAPVSYTDGEIQIGSPRTFSGNEHPQWKNSVIGTVGVGPSTPDGIRRSWKESRVLILDSLETELESVAGPEVSR